MLLQPAVMHKHEVVDERARRSYELGLRLSRNSLYVLIFYECGEKMTNLEKAAASGRAAEKSNTLSTKLSTAFGDK